MDKIAQFRKDKDALFGREAESPLTPEQKKGFKDLNYFAPNPSLIFHNLKLEPVVGDQLVQIKTSAGDTQRFKIKGKISFKVDGAGVELIVYDSTAGSGLFLPFRDKTNQRETYHDGRYVEVEEGELKRTHQSVKKKPQIASSD